MKKKLSYLLVFALVFTMLVPSFALAAGEDAKGHKYETSIKKLMALGVVAGDAGTGNIRPDDELTRAEFAKIAAYAGGYAKAAELLTGLNTGFKDVKADHWAAGYIALAASKGYLKGDPDGKFRPEDKISVAEAVTVLLRILGYNDNLPGSWPTDYITQAAVLGLFDNVQVAAGAKVKRGEVFALTDAVLSQSLVVYNKDTDRFDYVDADAGQAGVQTKSLIDTAFGTSFKTAVLTSPVLVGTNKDQIELDGTGVATSNLTVVGGDLVSLLGHEVKYLTVGGKVVYVQDAQASSNVVTGKLDTEISVTKDTYTVSGDKDDFSLEGVTSDYAIAQGTTFYFNGVKVGTTAAKAGEGAEATLFLKDGKVRFAVLKSYDANLKGVLAVKTTEKTAVRDARIYYNDDVTFKSVADNAVITRNGQAATLADIKANDVLYIGLNTDGKAVVIDAYNKVVTGKVELVRTSGSTTTITVNGVAYTSKVTNVSVGVEYTFYLGNNDIIFKAEPVNTATTGNDAYVVSKEPKITWETVNGVPVTKDVYYVTVRDLATKEEVKLFTKDTTVNPTVGSVVNYVVKDGKIDSISAVTLTNATLTEASDSKVIKLKDSNNVVTSYQVTDSTLIVSTNTNSNGKLATYDNVKGALAANSNGVAVSYKVSGFNVKYLFIDVNTSTVTSTDKVGVFTEKYSIVNASNQTEYHVVLNINGTATDIQVANATVADSVYKGDLVVATETTADGKYDSITVTNKKFAQLLNANASNLTFEANATFTSGATTGSNKYFLTSDTVVYVVTKDSNGAVTGISLGDAADVLGLNDSDVAVEFSLIEDTTVLGGYTKVKAIVVVKK